MSKSPWSNCTLIDKEDLHSLQYVLAELQSIADIDDDGLDEMVSRCRDRVEELLNEIKNN